MKVIKIRLNPDEYFIDVLHILQAIPPFNQLRNNDLNIYARLLFYNNLMILDGLEKEDRDKGLFNYDMKRLIQEELTINYGSYRNSLYSLKRLGLIGNKQLVDKFTIPFGESLEFNFI